MTKSADLVCSKSQAATILASRFLSEPKISVLAKRAVNTTFLASAGATKIIIRIADRQSLGRQPLKGFQKAARATELVAKLGIRTRRILLTGDTLVPYAYQVAEFVQGRTGDEAGGSDLTVWEQIGSLAAKINTIKTPGYGDELFDEPTQPWKTYISEHIDGIIRFQKQPLSSYRNQRVKFTDAEIRQLEQNLQSLKMINPDFRLIHSDLGPHNVIVDPGARVTAVIDWDLVKSFPLEHQIAICTFWNATHEPKAMARRRAFLRGYGQDYDPELVRVFQLYEFLTQLPYHTHQEAIQLRIREILGTKPSRRMVRQPAGHLAAQSL